MGPKPGFPLTRPLTLATIYSAASGIFTSLLQERYVMVGYSGVPGVMVSWVPWVAGAVVLCFL